MQVNSEDVTVAWGQAPHSLNFQYGKWRLAVFQDVQESIDATKLYFLYDPMADEQSGTSGTRKGYPGLVIFDLNLRCFVGEISIHNPGKMKFLFALKCPSDQGGSAFVLVTEEEIYGQIRLNISRVDLANDGLSIANVRSLINQPLTIGGEYICSMREDVPEIVVMANPGLQIWRIDCMAETAQDPVANFNVPGAELDHFYDGFLNNGQILLLSATPDGHFDNTRVHILNLSYPQHITTHNCRGDPSRGMPIPRKQCGFDSVTDAILMAGGEVDRGYGNVERLSDYWILDTRTFQWTQIPAKMPCPLIEPRVTSSSNSGNVYIWGDFDQPLPGMPNSGTHLRILRVTGLGSDAPPPCPGWIDQSNPPYPSDIRFPSHPSYDTNQGPAAGRSYGNAGTYTTTSDGQTAFYPEQKKKKKKNCIIQ